MFDIDRWFEVFQVLARNLSRSIVTAFGVFWGILIFLILMTFHKGLENGIKMEFGNTATNSIFVWSQRSSIEFDGLPVGRKFYFNLNDIGNIQSSIDGLEFISPRNFLGNPNGENNVVRGNNTGAFEIFGDYPEIIGQEPIQVTSGRFLNFLDIRENRKVAVIGSEVKDRLFSSEESHIGSYITINNVNFMVVGTVKKESSNADIGQGGNEIYIPFTSFSKAFNRGDRVDWIAITANEDISISDIKDKILSLLKVSHRLHPKDTRAIGYFDLNSRFQKILFLFGALRFIAYVVSLLILFSGIMGVSNIMIIIVKEREKEIGIRRALGENPWSIRMQILLESIVLTLFSGMLGIIMGTLMVVGLNYFLTKKGEITMFINPSIDIIHVALAMIVLLISGLLAGLIPANLSVKEEVVKLLQIK